MAPYGAFFVERLLISPAYSRNVPLERSLNKLFCATDQSSRWDEEKKRPYRTPDRWK